MLLQRARKIVVSASLSLQPTWPSSTSTTLSTTPDSGQCNRHDPTTAVHSDSTTDNTRNRGHASHHDQTIRISKSVKNICSEHIHTHTHTHTCSTHARACAHTHSTWRAGVNQFTDRRSNEIPKGLVRGRRSSAPVARVQVRVHAVVLIVMFL